MDATADAAAATPSSSTDSTPNPPSSATPTPPSPVAAAAPVSKRRFTPRRIYRPEANSLYDLMWDEAGSTLFMKPIFWTDMHSRLLDICYVELPRCQNIKATQDFYQASPRAESLCRQLTQLQHPELNGPYETDHIYEAIETLYPSTRLTAAPPRGMIDLNMYFSGLLYPSACRVQLMWECGPAQDALCESFQTISTRPAESLPGSLNASAVVPAGVVRQPRGNRRSQGLFSTNAPSGHWPLAATPRRHAPKPQPAPAFHDVTVHLMTNDDDGNELIVYTGGRHRRLSSSGFHAPNKTPAGKNALGEATLTDLGMKIEYTKVPIWPVVGLKERLGKALGRDLIGDFDENDLDMLGSQKRPSENSSGSSSSSSNNTNSNSNPNKRAAPADDEDGGRARRPSDEQRDEAGLAYEARAKALIASIWDGGSSSGGGGSDSSSDEEHAQTSSNSRKRRRLTNGRRIDESGRQGVAAKSRQLVE
ncbi:conserved hypothetical protein [Verticillium alfalfae VaMs.102]|uniref:Uncharacterized protein n=1 Tax=Verticillium alfalfae (strain VaMs.102 / ATCC MYA-4576 / FGSC 10136) TaxID=526221 RepID=C9SLM3_VERA1|nr:conserved hypothetical protein [Verticillium alfalfae VaMs.102]EEY19591.1 conserved hypothetical protein [Verticillium alfalfae VaMs.102]